MRCPSCGAFCKKRSLQCPECGAVQNKNSVPRPYPPQPVQTTILQEKTCIETEYKRPARPTSTLIAFPLATKTSIPQWRKELGERVREVQERRAREAALELGDTSVGIDVDRLKAPAQLELIPQADIPPINPLVVAALRRIERAHATSHFGSNALAIAVDCEEQPEYGEDMSLMTNEANAIPPRENMSSNNVREERVHNLAVVPSRPASIDEEAEPIRKPRRLISGDLNDPALNYLESIPTALELDKRECRVASVFSRVISGIVDLIVVSAISSGLVALALLPGLKWQEPRVIMYAVSTAIVVAFFYLTISTAMTGRTLGMKLLSLRVVDARTGFVPTGKQSAGRAVIYILSLVFAGIALLYTFFDAERNTFHDRFTQTAVIRA